MVGRLTGEMEAGREIASCQAALARMIEEFGRVDILLNCPSECTSPIARFHHDPC